jgi:hypothetical protein
LGRSCDGARSVFLQPPRRIKRSLLHFPVPCQTLLKGAIQSCSHEAPSGEPPGCGHPVRAGNRPTDERTSSAAVDRLLREIGSMGRTGTHPCRPCRNALSIRPSSPIFPRVESTFRKSRRSGHAGHADLIFTRELDRLRRPPSGDDRDPVLAEGSRWTWSPRRCSPHLVWLACSGCPQPRAREPEVARPLVSPSLRATRAARESGIFFTTATAGLCCSRSASAPSGAASPAGTPSRPR